MSRPSMITEDQREIVRKLYAKKVIGKEIALAAGLSLNQVRKIVSAEHLRPHTEKNVENAAWQWTPEMLEKWRYMNRRYGRNEKKD